MTSGSAAISFRKNELIRKGLSGGVFIAPYTSAAITKTNLFDAVTGAITGPLPAGYRDLGYLSAAGAMFARTTKVTDTISWQSVTPTRTDVTADTTTLKIVPQETNVSTLALFLGVDPASIAVGVNGAIEVDRVLAISVDTVTPGEIVYARFLPRAMVTAWDSQDMANGANPVEFGLTITSYVDSVLGYPEAYLIGGEGHISLLADEGFSRAITCSTATSTALTATTGNFFPNDVGAVVSGAGITVGTTIIAYVSSTVVTLSAATTATAAGVAVTINAEA
jgi:hypothetical protein